MKKHSILLKIADFPPVVDRPIRSRKKCRDQELGEERPGERKAQKNSRAIVQSKRSNDRRALYRD